MRIGERRESERDAEQTARAPRSSRPPISAASPRRAPMNGRDRLRQRQREGERQREMAGFDDHGLALPSCQRPCFFSASTTSRGM